MGSGCKVGECITPTSFRSNHVSYVALEGPGNESRIKIDLSYMAGSRWGNFISTQEITSRIGYNRPILEIEDG